MSGQVDLQLQRANELSAPPPKGKPYSLPIPGSKVEGRSAVYRHWKFTKGPFLETLDPAVGLASVRNIHRMDRADEI